MKLNWKQRRITECLVAFQKAGKKKFTMDEILPLVYVGAEEDPVQPRKALASGLRAFGFKLASEKGYKLRRASPIGRGHPGEYEFSGDFAALLEDNK